MLWGNFKYVLYSLLLASFLSFLVVFLIITIAHDSPANIQSTVAKEDIGEKLHLQIVGDYVAVYQGSSNYRENLLFITEISIWVIPEKWREAILSGETFFNDEKELLQALDSLDEFQVSF